VFLPILGSGLKIVSDSMTSSGQAHDTHGIVYKLLYKSVAKVGLQYNTCTYNARTVNHQPPGPNMMWISTPPDISETA